MARVPYYFGIANTVNAAREEECDLALADRWRVDRQLCVECRHCIASCLETTDRCQRALRDFEWERRQGAWAKEPEREAIQEAAFLGGKQAAFRILGFAFDGTPINPLVDLVIGPST